MSLWKFCSRGSLHDVIIKGSMMIDNFFVFALLRDVVSGLHFIHRSFLKYHGFLTSKCCLVDENWQAKISDYGLQELRRSDKRLPEDLLWTAPEILRKNDMRGSQEGDIYSFAIISAELVTKSWPWDINNRNEDANEILYMTKKGGHPLYRPELTTDGEIEVNASLIHLIRDCWTERPSERPPITMVKSQMNSMDARSGNLMDYVFNILEKYASTLEEEVAERTKELVEEKKKSDLLLYRMLPRQVAEKLKLGKSVEPETFDSVTVFFSDVVSFTSIAAKGTPLQVVNLLNDLYTIFDSIIDEHDVYKVETIGDGYLCASGLPNRNGQEHIKEICSMSLNFITSLQKFRVPHLPNERINLRIGVHTGSVVTGVVGLTMPRYCLFGDTVNTASRMESNGKPGMIHLSADACQLLLTVGGFDVKCRGEVMIKGKGVMETFWLLGRSNELHITAADGEPENPV
ncbi:putative phage head-tail adaptor [Dictyocaulus viviparus]|uniref:Guanylate cyclase n=1 Tax=Dictyocaulus viviparus TaxID=29172 RepID=A0A0D8X6S9_DICVI|nr:putative phage head-tail adaptor [Dictyocaulus viviparus]